MGKVKDYTTWSVVDLGEGRNVDGDESRFGITEWGYEVVTFKDDDCIKTGNAYGKKLELSPDEAIRYANQLIEAANELKSEM